MSLRSRLALAALLLVLLLAAGTSVAIGQQPAPATTPSAALTPTPTPDPRGIVTGGTEWRDIDELLRRFGLPFGLVAVLAMAAFAVLRVVGKENLETIGKRLNLAGWLFDALDRRRHLRERDRGALAYLTWLEGKYGRTQQLGIGLEQIDLDVRRVHVPLRVLESADAERYYRKMRGDEAEDDDAPARMSEVERAAYVFTPLSDPALLKKAREEQARRTPRPGRRRASQSAAVEMPLTTHCLLLLGDAGSGKTMTLCYAAMRMAAAYRQGRPQILAAEEDGLDLHLSRPPLPIYLRLTLFAQWLPSDPERLTPQERQEYLGAKPSLLLQWLDTEVSGFCDAPPGTLSSQIRRGHVFLLLDGLDEAGDEDRRAYLARLIVNLATTYPQNRYLVASRPAGYGRRVHLNDFAVRHLSPLDPRESRAVIENWFMAVEARLAEGGLRRQQQESAREQTDRLWSAIERSVGLTSMASNPLLVTAMALLQYNNVRLPEQRAKLYDKLVDLLLEIWRKKQTDDETIGINRSVPQLAAERGRIEQLALTMQQQAQQVREVTLEQAREWLSPQYQRRLGIDREDADARVRELLDSLALHSGLIQRRDGGYSFAHYTFQEYMAARALDGLDSQPGKPDSVAFLLERADDQRWHETLLLAAGHWGGSSYTLPKSERLVHGLLDRATLDALLLAGDALADIGPADELGSLRHETVLRLREASFDPARCPDPRIRNRAAALLDRLDGDNERAGLDLVEDGYWAKRIEPGSFSMGDNNGAYDDEKPQFDYTIRQPYALARFPVTNRQYLRFLEALERSGPAGREEAERRRPRSWPGRRYRPGEGHHPVVGVNWHDATAFAAWAHATMLTDAQRSAGEAIRLPSEPEWERAAAYPARLPGGNTRAGRREYPWGDWSGDADDPLFAALLADAGAQPDRGLPLNIRETGIGSTSAVGLFPHGAADCGAEDMAGNVWEWCATGFHNYPLPEDDKTLYTSDKNGTYVLRGGSWFRHRGYARCACRRDLTPVIGSGDRGFRLARLFSSGRS